MKIGEQAAFPVPHDALIDPQTGGVRGYVRDYCPTDSGMTYRQWLVGMAMQGLLANPNESPSSVDITAHVAVQMADAVLSQLEGK